MPKILAKNPNGKKNILKICLRNMASYDEHELEGQSLHSFDLSNTLLQASFSQRHADKEVQPGHNPQFSRCSKRRSLSVCKSVRA